MKRNNKGFTLIELIMVIVILGILAAVVVPKFFSFTSEAHASNRQAVVGAVRAGLNLYAANQLVTNGNRDFPDQGALAWGDIIDEVPENWTIGLGAGGVEEDTLIYQGIGEGDSAYIWLYDHDAASTTYTLTFSGYRQ